MFEKKNQRQWFDRDDSTVNKTIGRDAFRERANWIERKKK